MCPSDKNAAEVPLVGGDPLQIEHRPSWSQRSRLLRSAARASAYPIADHIGAGRASWLPVWAAASALDRLAGPIRPRRGTAVRRWPLEGFSAELVTARPPSQNDRAAATVLYFHGGAFVLGGLQSHRRHVASLSAAAGGAPVLNVAYRQLPRWSISQSIADGVTAFRSLLESGVDVGLVTGRYAWVAFTSRNAVKAVRERVEEYGLDARAFAGIKVAAVGEQTAGDLRAWGIEPDLVPSAAQSAAGLLEDWPGYDDVLDPIDRVLLPGPTSPPRPWSPGWSGSAGRSTT